MDSDPADRHGVAADGEFERRMLGNFAGMLRWPQFDALWHRLRQAPEGWFVSHPERPAPLQPADPGDFLAGLDEWEALLRRELGSKGSGKPSEYCGVVYVDEPDNPTFVKIFDPRTLGTLCSHGGAPIPPACVLSRCRPVRYPAPPPAAAVGGHRWGRWWRAG